MRLSAFLSHLSGGFHQPTFLCHHFLLNCTLYYLQKWDYVKSGGTWFHGCSKVKKFSLWLRVEDEKRHLLPKMH